MVFFLANVPFFLCVSVDFSIGVASSISSALLQTVCGTLLDRIFVVLSVFLLPINSTVPPAVFWDDLREAVLCASVANFLVWSRRFWRYYHKVFTYIFANIFNHIFSKTEQSISFSKYSISRLNWIFRFMYCYQLIEILFSLSSIAYV